MTEPETLSLPLKSELLPEAVRRFGDANAPAAARTMAARGLVPVRGADLLVLLCQLCHDGVPDIAEAAVKSLDDMPPAVLLDACASPLPAPVIDFLATRSGADEELLTALVTNHSAADETVARVARSASEELAERIAVNQQRLISAPSIIEALYLNRNTRMSTTDRLMELAYRHGLELKGLPTFAAHAEAVAVESTTEAVPEGGDLSPISHVGLGEGDLGLFGEMRAVGSAAADDYFLSALDALDEIDDYDDEDENNNRRKPLRNQIREMSISQKLRLSMLGNSAARAILVRDTNRLVSNAAISSPRMTVDEVGKLAKSREVGDDVLKHIARRRDWLRSYDVKRSLVFNPKTALGTAISLISHMRDSDLRSLSQSRDVPPAVRNAAKRRIQKKTKKK